MHVILKLDRRLGKRGLAGDCGYFGNPNGMTHIPSGLRAVVFIRNGDVLGAHGGCIGAPVDGLVKLLYGSVPCVLYLRGSRKDELVGLGL